MASRQAGVLLYGAALVAVAALIICDLAHGLRPSGWHGYAGSIALILGGFSYVAFQLAALRSRSDRWKAALLGIAFVLWGAEQLLPRSRWTTVMDTAVVAIFVGDLGWVVLQPPKKP